MVKYIIVEKLIIGILIGDKFWKFCQNKAFGVHTPFLQKRNNLSMGIIAPQTDSTPKSKIHKPQFVNIERVFFCKKW